MPRFLDQVCTRPIDPHASIGRLLEAFNEVLDLGVSHRLAAWSMSIINGPLEVRHGAGYCVQTLERLTSPAVAEAQPQCGADG
jgi:hypothetical protein